MCYSYLLKILQCCAQSLRRRFGVSGWATRWGRRLDGETLQLNINNLLRIETKNFYLFSDNQPAIALAKNPEHHSKTKHIDIQYHYVREKILEGEIILDYVNTKEQLADTLTKALSTSVFTKLFRKLNIIE